MALEKKDKEVTLEQVKALRDSHRALI